MRAFQFLICVSLLLNFTPCFAEQSGKGIVSVTEQDGSPEVYPWQVKVSNGTLTDNSDGTASIDTSGTSLTGFTRTGTNVHLTNPGDNLGIGLSNPAYKLHVLGSGYFSNDLTVGGSITSTTQSYSLGNFGVAGNIGAGTTLPLNRLDVQGSGNVILNMAGNVGVGTTNPKYILDISNNSVSSSFLRMTTRTSYSLTLDDYANLSISSNFSAQGGKAQLTYDTNTLDSGVSSNVKLLITSGKSSATRYPIVLLPSGNGNIGISTSGPIAKLHLVASDTGTASALRIQDFAGVDKVTVLDNGNVGIATTLPTVALEIGTTTPGQPALFVDRVSGRVGIGTTKMITKLNIMGQAASIKLIRTDNTTDSRANVTMVPAGTLSSSNSQWGFGMAGIDDNSFDIDTWDGSSDIVRLRIANTGNVGIGIGNNVPSRLLDVNGTSNFSGIIKTNGNYISGDGGAEGISVDSVGNVGIGTTAPTAKLHVLGTSFLNGNVGIGTTGPVEKLSVVSDGTGGTRTASFYGPNGLFVAGSVADDTGFVMRNISGIPTVAATYNTTGAYQPLAFATNALERMRISTSGNVGVGTTSPTAKMQVVGGTIKIGTTGNQAVLCICTDGRIGSCDAAATCLTCTPLSGN